MNEFDTIMLALAEADIAIGKTLKLTELKKITEFPEFKKLCNYVLNPDIKFGIKLPEPNVVENVTRQVNVFSFGEIFDIFDSLLKKEIVGKAAKHKVTELFSKYVGWEKMLTNFLNKKLIAGVSKSTILEVYPDLFYSRELQLIEEFSEDRIKGDIKDYVWEPKYDGRRVALTMDPKTGQFIVYSRNFKKIFPENFSRILEGVKHILQAGYVLDGEASAPAKGGKKAFDVTSSIVSSQFLHEDFKDLTFQVFDMFPRELLDTKGIYDYSLKDRRAWLESTFNPYETHFASFGVKLVAQNQIETLKSLKDLKNQMLSQGLEGIVVKRLDSPYSFTRSHDWMRMKSSNREDLRIAGFTPGKNKFSKPPTTELKVKLIELGYNSEDVDSLKQGVGAVVVDRDGFITSVGSGLTDEERYSFFLDRNNLIGKYAEVEFHSITKQGMLREPTFNSIREDK